MKRHTGFFALVVIVASQLAFAQPDTPPALDRAKVVAAATDVIRQAHHATFVTISSDKHPDARIVTPAAPDQNLEIWISTLKTSRKIAQLRKDPRATMLYFDQANMAYVTLIGKITIVSDPAEMQKHWQAEWAPFYPDGTKSPGFIMMRFVPDRVEVVSRQHKLMPDPWGLAILKLK